MPSLLCITLRFLDAEPRFHGKDADGEPEWPPSPLRLFQAVLAAAATRWRDGAFDSCARPALAWLQGRSFEIVSPVPHDRSFGFRMYVPNNSGDLMTAAWARGDTETTMAKFRVEKDVRPLRLQDNAVHFLVATDLEFEPLRETLQAAVRSVTHLGWGVDMVAADAQVITQAEADKLPGERWRPNDHGHGTPLRLPKPGTLDDLLQRHQQFLHRLDGGGFKPVPPLRAFDTIHYAHAAVAPPRPVVAFQILDAQGDRVLSFDTARQASHVAAWVRHAAGKACEGWPHGDANAFVHGHADGSAPLRGDHADRRFAFLPLPTINPGVGGRVEAVRRVLVAAPPGHTDEINWLRRRLPASEVVEEGRDQPFGILNLLPNSDWVLQRYLRPARVWSTVTPVVLQRHEVESPAEIDRLLALAVHQAGVTAPMSRPPEWQHFGFHAGVVPTKHFRHARNLSGTRLHVRLTFDRPVAGPLAVGAGRYRGLGVFASNE